MCIISYIRYVAYVVWDEYSKVASDSVEQGAGSPIVKPPATDINEKILLSIIFYTSEWNLNTFSA